MNKAKQCKTQGCNNPVLEGEYCRYCQQARKENREQGLKVAGVAGGVVVLIKVAIKYIPKLFKLIR